MNAELPIVSFKTRADLRSWPLGNFDTSIGVYIRIYKVHSKILSVGFEEVLDEGLCFGWSESKRLPYDDESYLQRFTPRKSRGTTSDRNKRHAKKLIEQGLMTQAGLNALGDLG